MAHIQRLYDFQAGTKIVSGQVDAEFNQLINYVNGLDDANGLLAGATGATKVGVGEGGTLQALLDQLVRFATANIKHIRLNVDKVIETSSDGVNWEASGSSGHLIQRANGEILTQRSRLQFLNTTITDDATNNRTVIQGLVGPTGPQGIQGPQGNQGIQGPTGKSIIPDVNQTTGLMSFSEGGPGVIPSPVNVRGPQGIAGVAGPQGPAGAPGPVGVQGAPGPAGIQGVPGIQGLKGDKGATGPEGPQGARGLKGDTGNTGAQGPAGPQGIQGAVGAQGPQGPQGLKGDDGADGTSFAILGVYPTLLALQTAHPVGDAGDAWFIGSTAPYSVYSWDTNVSQWVNVGQLEGPQGPQGIQGIQGPQGIQGETGAKGEQGPQGPQGPQGELGPGYYPQGAWVEEADYVRDDTQIDVVDYEGSSYFCKLSHESDDGNKPPHSTYWGLLAEKGDQGVQGIQGPQGIQGIQGPQGIQGAQGNPGPGLPVGGTVGQVPVKASTIDYHTVWTTLTAEDVEAAAVTHNHTVSNITDFPATMPPDDHTHTVSNITDFPASMTPTAHKSTHAIGGSDAIVDADIGVSPDVATALGLMGDPQVKDALKRLYEINVSPRIVATAPTGSTVTCSKDGITLTAAESSGTWTFNVPDYGTWTVTGTLGADTDSKAVVVDQVKLYTTSIAYLDDTFFENTWAKIIGTCQSGSVPAAWVVGNQKTMTINGASYTVTIIGKNHDTYTAGGTAPLTFQLQDCYGTKYQMNATDTNSGGWTSCAMRTTHLPAILALMPAEAQTGIREVNKLSSAGSQSSTINTTADKLFLLSEMEIFGSKANSQSSEGSQYAYYSAGNSKVKNFSGSTNFWWERSPVGSNSTAFCIVNASGDANISNASNSIGVAFGFCF